MKRKVVPFILASAIVVSSLALTPTTVVNANDTQETYEEVTEELEETIYSEEETEELEELEETEELEEAEQENVQLDADYEIEVELLNETVESVLIYTVTNEIAKNIDGNQGEIQLEHTLEDLEEQTVLTLTASEFTNEMDSINVAIRIDNEAVEVRLELTEGSEITFELPEEYIGKTITVITSTNSENQGQARLELSNN